MSELIHKELSEAIIGDAMTVLNVLRPGLDEKLYENAMVIELTKRGHKIDQQRQFPVHYDGQLIGTLIPDLIVDPKVVTAFNDNHIAQMIGYLKYYPAQTSSIAQLQKRSTGMEASGTLI